MALNICQRECPDDPNIVDLELQRKKFDERNKSKPSLDELPDLVDPSSSDSDDSDLDEEEVRRNTPYLNIQSFHAHFASDPRIGIFSFLFLL